MVKKLTYDFINEEFKKRNYVLVEKEYKNVMTKMEYYCTKHPNETQYIKYNDLKNGHGCKLCGIESRVNNQKLNINEVIVKFGEHNLVLLESIYVNSSTKMKCYCKIHTENIIERSIRDLRKNVACSICSKKIRKTIEEIESEFKKRNYKLLTKEYVNNTTYLEYICENHPNKIRRITWNDFQQGAGCYDCGLEKVRDSKIGENNPNWDGGLTELNSWLRSCVDVWRKKVKNRSIKCFVTGEENENLEIHHSFPFYKIRDITLEKLELDKREKISDYSTEEIDAIRKLFLTLHGNVYAVALSPDIHKLFHKIYGDDVSFKDLKEFKQKYLRGEVTI